jgi:hypothetical protein
LKAGNVGFPLPFAGKRAAPREPRCKSLEWAEAIDFTRVLQAFPFAKNRAPGYNNPYFFDPLSCFCATCS